MLKINYFTSKKVHRYSIRIDCNVCLIVFRNVNWILLIFKMRRYRLFLKFDRFYQDLRFCVRVSPKKNKFLRKFPLKVPNFDFFQNQSLIWIWLRVIELFMYHRYNIQYKFRSSMDCFAWFIAFKHIESHLCVCLDNMRDRSNVLRIAFFSLIRKKHKIKKRVNILHSTQDILNINKLSDPRSKWYKIVKNTG